MTHDEILYVDEYVEVVCNWVKEGNSPYLHNTDDDYIWVSGNGYQIHDFMFRDLPMDAPLISCFLFIEGQCSGEAGGSLGFFIYDGDAWSDEIRVLIPYWGAASDIWSWVNYDISSILNTQAKINASKLWLVCRTSHLLNIRRAYLFVSLDWGIPAKTGSPLLLLLPHWFWLERGARK